MNTDFSVCRITSTQAVAKMMWLDSEGETQKKTCAAVYSGEVEIIKLSGLQEFSNFLQRGINPRQCITYGLPKESATRLVTKKFFDANIHSSCDEEVARTNAMFSWAKESPSVLMLDYDAKEDSDMTPEKMVSLIRTEVPFLANVSMLHTYSASSWIYRADVLDHSGNPSLVQGGRGHRIYLLIKDGNSAKNIGTLITDWLWCKGHGHFELSKSGALLERGFFDKCVWQPSRIDFVAGSVCTEPFFKYNVTPTFFQGQTEVLDISLFLNGKKLETELEECAKAAEKNKSLKRAEVEPLVEANRKVWIKERRESVSKNINSTCRDIATKRADTALTLLVYDKLLTADMSIEVKNSRGESEIISVSHLLAYREKYHGAISKDPIEPDYDGGRWVGKLYLSGTNTSKPILFSQAHGGTTFTLTLQTSEIELTDRTSDICLQMWNRIIDNESMYHMGDVIVDVQGAGKIVRQETSTLRHNVGLSTLFFKYVKNKMTDQVEKVYYQPPIPAEFSPMMNFSGLRKLNAVANFPMIKGNGEILKEKGYDKETGILYEGDDISSMIPLNPTNQELENALSTLWHPFHLFSFATEEDRGAMLLALITGVQRALLDKSPIIAFDAIGVGNGKSTLADCISILAAEDNCGASPISKDEDETRKSILSNLIEGRRIIYFDNIDFHLKSASLAAFVTQDFYKDRILGSSKTATLPNRSLVILTGNNLSLSPDLIRRTIRSRLDTKSVAPYSKQFPFNPVELCKANKLKMVCAVITLLKGWHCRGKPHTNNIAMGAFTEWDNTCRHPFLWIIDTFWKGYFKDPVARVQEDIQEDPEAESFSAFLEAWSVRFQDNILTTANLLEDIQKLHPENKMFFAVKNLGIEIDKLNLVTLGLKLKSKAGCVMQGCRFRLEQRKLKANKSGWQLVSVDEGTIHHSNGVKGD